MKTAKTQLVAMVEKMDELAIRGEYENQPHIEIVIATLADDGKPRNWRWDSEQDRKCMGGQRLRIFPYRWKQEPVQTLCSTYGPAVESENAEEYMAAARGVQTLKARLAAFETERGYSADSAELAGRWLEACGVKLVLMRREGVRQSVWLNECDWKQLSVGDAVNMIRQNLPAAVEKRKADKLESQAA